MTTKPIPPRAEDVKAYRQRHELTQREAADLARVSEGAWQKWEYGQRQMDLKTWELLLYKKNEMSAPYWRTE